MAIKDSSGDLPHMIRMIKSVRPNRPDFSFLTGWDAALMPMLLIGCDGGTNATSGIVPELTRKLYDLTLGRPARRGPRVAIRPDHAVRHDDLLGRVSRRLPGGALSCAAFEWAPAASRFPQSSRPTCRAVSNTLQCLLAEQGFTDEPVGGCPPANTRVDASEVSQIVEGVLAELKRRRPGLIEERELNSRPREGEAPAEPILSRSVKSANVQPPSTANDD